MSNINTRIFLWVALALVLWVNYETWQRDYATRPGGPPAASAPSRDGAAGAPESSLEASIPQASSPAGAERAPAGAAAPASSAGAAAATADAAAQAAPGVVRVRTDVLELHIGLQGGELRRADLLDYPKEKNRPQDIVRLFNRDDPQTLFVLQTGLAGPGDSSAHPTHFVRFKSPAESYTLPAGADTLTVPLTWTDGRGVTVTKIFTFRRGSYRIELEQRVENASGAPWQAAQYGQLLRDDPEIDQSMFNPETYAFRGPAYFDGEKYQKLDIGDDEDRSLVRDVKGGWIAGMQHHFVAAIVPPPERTFRFTLQADEREYLLSAAGPLRTVAPGATASFPLTLFVGPKLQGQLSATGPRLDRVADYGALTILSEPLFWVLSKIHAVVGNWGWAIVIVTFLLKLLFYPLSEASGRSMAKMKALAPRMKNLQETYKDDREKLGRAMMELYQREKVNPVAGCLPILVQIPVFLAFYWVLLESVEMRQAPFMGWIDDLSARDPFFILPAIMAGAMFVQYKLNPTPPDPVQAKVFMIMPLVMSVMFAFFPAGLVLYWVTNTILSIAQQWNINRRIEAAMKKS